MRMNRQILFFHFIVAHRPVEISDWEAGRKDNGQSRVCEEWPCGGNEQASNAKRINQLLKFIRLDPARYERITVAHQINVVACCANDCDWEIRSDPAQYANSLSHELLFVRARAHRYQTKVRSSRLS